ncbi:MAG: hypothetical protein M1830_008997 [Pleopsidium flavum]|nr:MAG: hypothetical protein M1830_008997 [Pleopsidium flavum]
MSSEDALKLALRQNRSWAQNTAKENPKLFPTLAAGQQPEILWIGCSDSRVPETTVCGLKPGDVFVHRNIANILHPGDLNAGAVIEYAVVHLKVKHIVVCGHISCGGVKAALGNEKLGLLDTWLVPLRSLRRQHLHTLKALPQAEAAKKLVEYNVLQGIKTLKENATVIDAMRDHGICLHALVYDVACGELHELSTDESSHSVKDRKEACETWPEGHVPRKDESQKSGEQAAMKH